MTPDGTATHDWADARHGSGSEHPALLPAGEAHLSVERTFSFVDLSGFTGFTQDHGPHAAVAMLSEFRHTTRLVAAKRGVRVAKWLGDGAMLIGVEPTPVIALGAHLIHHFAGTDLRVRVGVATGTALLFEGDDYIGEPVNLAFKLCDAAQPGEMLAHCGNAELPDWVIPSGGVEVLIRGVGAIADVVRLQPKLIATAHSGAA
ncbi:MAG: adenylate/guanylate cyclase domain-containing protein [Acidimicrobiia bacterium]|nr:adenylate/guanylate cyclase domain-containing protein [Acidimicrobiia bacterium]